tara:strand:+ start:546 stop:857 length:312 start_codon:yes stop_codon:yes gene_type:complete
MKSINKKNYNDFLDMTASELRVVAKMAERMANDAEALESPTQENFEHLLTMDTCMRAAFHAMHKGYSMMVRPYSRITRADGSKRMKEAFENIGRTIDAIEANN